MVYLNDLIGPGFVTPRTILLVPLRSDIEVKKFTETLLSECTDKSASPLLKGDSFMISCYSPADRQKLTVISPERSLLPILDAAKVSDVVIFLLPHVQSKLFTKK